MSALLFNLLGADVSMIRSVMVAHSSLVVEKFRYSFSQIMLMALFLASRLSRSSPPWFMGLLRVSSAILGDESSFHMKVLIILSRISAVSSGILCACIRNWVCLPMMIWVIIFLLFRVGWALFQCPSLVLILSITSSHGVRVSIRFPIYAPSHQQKTTVLTMTYSFDNLQMPYRIVHKYLLGM